MQRTIEQMLDDASGFFLNECFFLQIDDMHVQTVFIEDLEKPLAFGKLLLWVVNKDETVYSQFQDNKEGIA